jgi:hypothetical protein
MKWIKRLSDYHPVEYLPRDEDGEVRKIGCNWKQPDQLVRILKRDMDEGATSMVIATCAFQMNPTIEVLRKHGMPFWNKWRKTRGDWNPIDRSRAGSTTSKLAAFAINDFNNGLWTLKAFSGVIGMMKKKGLLTRDGAEMLDAECESTPDEKVTFYDLNRWLEPDAVTVIQSLVRDNSPERFLEWIEEGILASHRKAIAYPMEVARKHGIQSLAKDPSISVGTIHSVKGGEADRVYYFPDLSASGRLEYIAGGERRDNVIRMFYVAMTRARSRLTLCAPASGAAMAG